jgi:chemotaxis signal transduction protein
MNPDLDLDLPGLPPWLSEDGPGAPIPPTEPMDYSTPIPDLPGLDDELAPPFGLNELGLPGLDLNWPGTSVSDDSSVALNQQLESAPIEQPATLVAEEPKAISAPVSDGISESFIGSVVRTKQSVRVLVDVQTRHPGGLSGAILRADRFPGIRKVKSNHPLQLDGAYIVWNLGELPARQSRVISITLPADASSSYLLESPWVFELTGSAKKVPEVSVNFHAPKTGHVGHNCAVIAQLMNSHQASAERVIAKVKHTTTGAEYFSTSTALAPNQAHELVLSIPELAPGINELLAWIEVDGNPLPPSLLQVKVELPRVQIQADEVDVCWLDNVCNIKGLIVNQSNIPLDDLELTLTSTPEFSVPLDGVKRFATLPANSADQFLFTIRGENPGHGKVTIALTATGILSEPVELTIPCRIPEGTEGVLDGLLAIFQSNAKREDHQSLEITQTRATGERHILFALGEAGYSIPLSAVTEVMREPISTPVPGTAEWIIGVTNVRGQIATVIDLPRYLELNTLATTRRRALLLCNLPDGMLGFLVDEVSGIRRFTPNPVDDEIRHLEHKIVPFMTGMAELNQRLVPVLNFEQIAAALESTVA